MAYLKKLSHSKVLYFLFLNTLYYSTHLFHHFPTAGRNSLSIYQTMEREQASVLTVWAHWFVYRQTTSNVAHSSDLVTIKPL